MSLSAQSAQSAQIAQRAQSAQSAQGAQGAQSAQSDQSDQSAQSAQNAPWQASVPCKEGHLDQQHCQHRHVPDTDHHHAHLGPGTQLDGGGSGANFAAALLTRWAQHLGKENIM